MHVSFIACHLVWSLQDWQEEFRERRYPMSMTSNCQCKFDFDKHDSNKYLMKCFFKGICNPSRNAIYFNVFVNKACPYKMKSYESMSDFFFTTYKMSYFVLNKDNILENVKNYRQMLVKPGTWFYTSIYLQGFWSKGCGGI